MAKVRCQVCGDEVHEELLGLHEEAERWWLRRIRREDPEWVEEDGSCPRCLEYYGVTRRGHPEKAA